jgi:hypothetical protein
MSLGSVFWGDASSGFWGCGRDGSGSSGGAKRCESACAAKVVMTMNWMERRVKIATQSSRILDASMVTIGWESS